MLCSAESEPYKSRKWCPTLKQQEVSHILNSTLEGVDVVGLQNRPVKARCLVRRTLQFGYRQKSYVRQVRVCIKIDIESLPAASNDVKIKQKSISRFVRNWDGPCAL
jgi:hypothetical protein